MSYDLLKTINIKSNKTMQDLISPALEIGEKVKLIEGVCIDLYDRISAIKHLEYSPQKTESQTLCISDEKYTSSNKPYREVISGAGKSIYHGENSLLKILSEYGSEGWKPSKAELQCSEVWNELTEAYTEERTYVFTLERVYFPLIRKSFSSPGASHVVSYQSYLTNST